MNPPARTARFAAVLLLLSLPASGAAGAEAYVIVDNYTGHILAQQGAESKRQVASLTKIATAMVTLDWAEKSGQNLSQPATVPPQALQQGGANPVGLQPGDQLSLRDLIYAALMQSDNIAAYTIAAHVGGDLRRLSPPDTHDLGPVGLFVAQMNALTRQLGMTRTLFLNPHGLEPPEGRPPYSTAKDMARLARYAMSNSGFRFYVSQKERKIAIQRGGASLGYLLRSTNETLGTDGIDGVKTGRTSRAGDCLIVSAERTAETRQDGPTVYVTPRRLTVVVLAAQNRFGEAVALLRNGWQLYGEWAASGRQTSEKQKI